MQDYSYGEFPGENSRMRKSTKPAWKRAKHPFYSRVLAILGMAEFPTKQLHRKMADVLGGMRPINGQAPHYPEEWVETILLRVTQERSRYFASHGNDGTLYNLAGVITMITDEQALAQWKRDYNAQQPGTRYTSNVIHSEVDDRSE